MKSFRVLLLCIALVSPARADDDADADTAAELFRAGKVAFEQHDYAAAAESFEQAFAKAPRGATSFAAAIAWDAAREKPDRDIYRRTLPDFLLRDRRHRHSA